MNTRKLDPRSKIIAFLVVCMSVMNSPKVEFTVLIGTLIVLLALYQDVFHLVKKKYWVLLGTLAIELLLRLMEPTPAVMIVLMMLVLAKMYLPIMMLGQIIYKSTTISEFMSAFTKMKVPAVIIIPLAVMFRFVPTVQEEWNGIRHAMGFRGISMRFRYIFFHPVETAEYILVPLLFSCVNVMDELVAASLARGLDSSRKRTCMVNVKMTLADYIIVTVFIALGTYIFIL